LRFESKTKKLLILQKNYIFRVHVRAQI
jgi:hypothetical protein